MIYSADKCLFSRDELACKGTGVCLLNPVFEEKLKELRIKLDMPMQVNSCCRDPGYNKSIGGHKRSLHLTEGGWIPGTGAIDIACPDNIYKARLGGLALMLGWSVGVYRTFLHLDIRSVAGMQQSMFWGADP